MKKRTRRTLKKTQRRMETVRRQMMKDSKNTKKKKTSLQYTRLKTLVGRRMPVKRLMMMKEKQAADERTKRNRTRRTTVNQTRYEAVQKKKRERLFVLKDTKMVDLKLRKGGKPKRARPMPIHAELGRSTITSLYQMPG